MPGCGRRQEKKENRQREKPQSGSDRPESPEGITVHLEEERRQAERVEDEPGDQERVGDGYREVVPERDRPDFLTERLGGVKYRSLYVSSAMTAYIRPRTTNLVATTSISAVNNIVMTAISTLFFHRTVKYHFTAPFTTIPRMNP